jgi:hypothetical protein
MKKSILSLKLFSLALGCLLLVYVFSSAPVARWVISPVLSSATPESFTIYDVRLSRYFSVYAPLFWVRSRSTALDATFSAYEAVLRPRRSSGWHLINSVTELPTALVTRSFYFIDGFHLWHDAAQRPNSAFDERAFLHAQGVDLPSGGYAYALPHSQRLIVRAREAELDLITTLISSEGNETHSSIAAEANLD